MKIQMATDYAIRALHYIHENSDTTLSGREIAEAIDVPYPFFAKIADQLKRKGLLTSIKGRKGGYALGKPLERIGFYEVFVATEGELQISRCLMEHRNCNRANEESCGLRGFLCDLQKSLIVEMSRKNILEIA
ncbi:MAG: Rrf2 family transcriptional regulator [Oscillospiraceae bacterium]|nr:Rrf2 family transcriptional regulator [Oscillospiraceae bacterium]